MTQAPTALDPPETILETWVARTVHPIILLGVVGVFAAFAALAHFVFHSAEGVRALLLAAVGAVVATTPAVLSKVEYRLTPSGLDRRSLAGRNDTPFRPVFRWDELTHLIRKRRGFTFRTHLDESNALRRFWKLHVSDRYSGEVHVERVDVERVLRAIEAHGVPMDR